MSGQDLLVAARSVRVHLKSRGVDQSSFILWFCRSLKNRLGAIWTNDLTFGNDVSRLFFIDALFQLATHIMLNNLALLSTWALMCHFFHCSCTCDSIDPHVEWALPEIRSPIVFRIKCHIGSQFLHVSSNKRFWACKPTSCAISHLIRAVLLHNSQLLLTSNGNKRWHRTVLWLWLSGRPLWRILERMLVGSAHRSDTQCSNPVNSDLWV